MPETSVYEIYGKQFPNETVLLSELYSLYNISEFKKS